MEEKTLEIRESTIFRDSMPCSPADVTDVSQECTTFIRVKSKPTKETRACLHYSPLLKMEIVPSCEISPNIY
jgi:hypothetical protein